ncbi:MAG: leucine-rich repeat domain-containing protein, partial [Microcoleus sp. SIO2G3]|nr:leucine-rich repeat domain-containing protein [Microcoleus sp. SIO2G3]
NQIRDVEPLKSLTQLTALILFDNQISDISTLKSLSQLRSLEVQGNLITNKTCPLSPASICQF